MAFKNGFLGPNKRTRRQVGATAVSMTRDNQRELELALQKNMKKQSDFKGKCPEMMGFLLRPQAERHIIIPRDSEIMQQKQKRANKEEEPK